MNTKSKADARTKPTKQAPPKILCDRCGEWEKLYETINADEKTDNRWLICGKCLNAMLAEDDDA